MILYMGMVNHLLNFLLIVRCVSLTVDFNQRRIALHVFLVVENDPFPTENSNFNVPSSRRYWFNEIPADFMNNEKIETGSYRNNWKLYKINATLRGDWCFIFSMLYYSAKWNGWMNTYNIDQRVKVQGSD